MLIDAHAHLDGYDDALEVALAEIRDRRILTISTAMDVPSYWRTLEVARGCEFVLPTFGLHPWNAPEYVTRLEEVRETIESSPMLGEIGLDYHFVEDTSQYPPRVCCSSASWRRRGNRTRSSICIRQARRRTSWSSSPATAFAGRSSTGFQALWMTSGPWRPGGVLHNRRRGALLGPYQSHRPGVPVGPNADGDG